MMRRLSAAVVTVVLILWSAGTLFAQRDIIINIYEPGTAKVKIAIPSLVHDPVAFGTARPGTGEEFARILRDDLDFTGMFEVFTSPPAYPDTSPGAGPYVPLKAWLPLDVQAAVQGKYALVNGQLRFECAVFDVESESRIVGRRYTGPPRELRSIAHRFADEIVYRFTGKRGIAHTSLAYVKGNGRQKEIYIMDYDGHGSYRLTYDNSIVLSPEWSPDGKSIAFTSYRDRNPDVYVANLESKTYKRVSGFIGLNTTPAFSPDGKTLALTLSKDGNPELYLLDLRRDDFTRITRNSRIDTSPTWSPNGRELAFISDRSGYPQVYIIDREGVNLRRLTYSGYYNTSPAWSPAGDKIAYVATVQGKAEIFTISPTGGDLQRLTFNGGNEDPSWSPDGKYLAYCSNRGGRRDIYIMRADGSGRRRVTMGGGDNMSPAWSP